MYQKYINTYLNFILLTLHTSQYMKQSLGEQRRTCDWRGSKGDPSGNRPRNIHGCSGRRASADYLGNNSCHNCKWLNPLEHSSVDISVISWFANILCPPSYYSLTSPHIDEFVDHVTHPSEGSGSANCNNNYSAASSRCWLGVISYWRTEPINSRPNNRKWS